MNAIQMLYFIYVILLKLAFSLDLSKRCITQFDFITFTELQFYNDTVKNNYCYRSLSSEIQTFVMHTVPNIRNDSRIILSHNAIKDISLANIRKFWNTNYFAIDYNHLSIFRIQKLPKLWTGIILANNNQIRYVHLNCTDSLFINRTRRVYGHLKLL
ncbi:hypothetical protein GJ496_010839 [Pomphorhynchus laevis]|nr:hypothetical protein GJ496_010839 [Pomphorhynchus laevis]